jgi:oxalate decarboxylase/phosphoglucose isomerase-like protein (cupin superfamily)
MKATGAETGGALTFTEIDATPGGGPPVHVHENKDEWFYVLEGTFDIVLGDQVVRAEPGDFAGGHHMSQTVFEDAAGDHDMRVVDWSGAGEPAAD